MDFFFGGINEDTSECPFNVQDIQRCPFLRNIDKPTNFSFSSVSILHPARVAKGPIFEDGPNFDMAFKLFHGKNGVVPLSGRSQFSSVSILHPARVAKGPIFEDGPNFDMACKLFHGKNGVVPLSGRSQFHDQILDAQPTPQFNPLAAKAATISLSAFGPGGPFSFDSFSRNWKNQKEKSESLKKKEQAKGGDSSKHEAAGKEWLETGNCPIAKSYRAVSSVLPLVASALQPPPGMKLRCPPAVVAARAALAQTAFAKNLRPQPLPAKMLVIGAIGMAANIPLGIWKEHTKKFSLSWFAAVHAAVPFIAMLRKSVLMPKNAMALTIAASILGQVIGSRAERIRLKAKAERKKVKAQAGIIGAMKEYGSDQGDGFAGAHCGTEEMTWGSLPGKVAKPSSSPVNICF